MTAQVCPYAMGENMIDGRWYIWETGTGHKILHTFGYDVGDGFPSRRECEAVWHQIVQAWGVGL